MSTCLSLEAKRVSPRSCNVSLTVELLKKNEVSYLSFSKLCEFESSGV